MSTFPSKAKPWAGQKETLLIGPVRHLDRHACTLAGRALLIHCASDHILDPKAYIANPHWSTSGGIRKSHVSQLTCYCPFLIT